MPIIAKKPEDTGSFDKIPAGTYKAVCYGVWDLGIQKIEWQGNTKQKHQVIISWEIDKRIEAEGEYQGKRYVISKKYTVSLFDQSHLYVDLTSWRGRAFTAEEMEGFDLELVKGANCMLSVVHKEKNGKTYVNVGAVMALPKGTEKMTPETSDEPPQWVKDIQAKAIVSQDELADAIDADEILSQSEDTDKVPF